MKYIFLRKGSDENFISTVVSITIAYSLTKSPSTLEHRNSNLPENTKSKYAREAETRRKLAGRRSRRQLRISEGNRTFLGLRFFSWPSFQFCSCPSHGSTRYNVVLLILGWLPQSKCHSVGGAISGISLRGQASDSPSSHLPKL